MINKYYLKVNKILFFRPCFPLYTYVRLLIFLIYFEYAYYDRLRFHIYVCISFFNERKLEVMHARYS